MNTVSRHFNYKMLQLQHFKRHIPIRIGYNPVKKAVLEGVLDGKT